MKTTIRYMSYAILGCDEDRSNAGRHRSRSERATVYLRAPNCLTTSASTASGLTAMTAAPSG